MYTSTRTKTKVDASKAILNGMANDGGLYYPCDIKSINIEEIVNLNYKEMAILILKQFLNDFDEKDIIEIVNKAYDNKFDVSNIINIKHCSKANFLELFHGPTLAFKDLALSVLPLLIEKSKKINNVKEKTLILTATSGDTGSAALCGFNHSEDISMVVFYPTDGISKVQENQMLYFKNDRLHPIAIKGNFDDAQRLVKDIFNDSDMINYFHKKNISLSSANSINIGRLIPQIVYYFYSYIDLIKKGFINLYDKVNFVVPTGNFGNILAAYIAKEMGLPINKLICASNDNNVLTDFFNTHIYDKNRPFYKTISPSMDILVSSNLERLLYAIYKDEKMIAKMMNELKINGKYILPKDDEKFDVFYANYATEDDVLTAIKEVFERDNYLIDTHTAVAYSVYMKYLQEKNDNTPTIIASTASPLKFPKAVCKAIGLNDDLDDFILIKNICEIAMLNDDAIKNLDKYYDKEVWEKEDAFIKLKEIFGCFYE